MMMMMMMIMVIMVMMMHMYDHPTGRASDCLDCVLCCCALDPSLGLALMVDDHSKAEERTHSTAHNDKSPAASAIMRIDYYLAHARGINGPPNVLLGQRGSATAEQRGLLHSGGLGGP
ncbi:hypothetical protein F5Y18DRAFT_380413 [Xylariaceae sp. FL1019]|nr:hypothetical protein F5Y18DRAFT_380413 [Xylariaceae sp. FL1019]